MITNLPNLLTLSRIAAIPLLVGALFLETDVGRWTALAIFIAAAVTDYFDGYLARILRETSNFGRFMDPIADKLLVATALLMLVAFGHLSKPTVIAAAVILCREFLVSGLREFLADLHVEGLPVSRLAKWKTGAQMLAIGLLIVGTAAPPPIPAQAVGEFLLWVAAALTLVTGFTYFRASFRHLSSDSAPGSGSPATGDD